MPCLGAGVEIGRGGLGAAAGPLFTVHDLHACVVPLAVGLGPLQREFFLCAPICLVPP